MTSQPPGERHLWGAAPPERDRLAPGGPASAAPPGTPGEPPPPGARARDGWGPAPAPSSVITMHPRTGVLLVAGFATLLLSALVVLLPVPYAMLSAGPAINTLGDSDAKPLISITGHATHATTGELDLTTVTIEGGPGRRLTLLQAVRGWLDPNVAVLPEQDLFPPGQTAQQSQAETQQEMISSQESATVAALGELGILVPTTLTVSDVSANAPARGALRDHDVIIAVDRTPVADLTGLRDVVGRLAPGDPVTVRVLRAGRPVDVATRTTANDRKETILGVYIDPTFHIPFQVKIQIDNIGGPSAGTMFALGIIDKLTDGALTGGKNIAGTGTMDPDGTVGPIGGIQQKLVGARAAGAQWFLAPTSDCSEVVGHVPSGLSVVRISTLHDARLAVQEIAAGRGGALATCTR